MAETRAIISIIDNLESTSPTDGLSANMGRVLNETKQDKVEDSGWLTLPLLNGAVAYSEAQKPQYRKIGNVVYMRGVFKGVTTTPVTIAQLPEGYRPAMKVIIPQLATGMRIDRMEYNTDGTVAYTGATTTAEEATWHSLHTFFLVD